jgi:hypothetical protein
MHPNPESCKPYPPTLEIPLAWGNMPIHRGGPYAVFLRHLGWLAGSPHGASLFQANPPYAAAHHGSS